MIIWEQRTTNWNLPNSTKTRWKRRMVSGVFWRLDLSRHHVQFKSDKKFIVASRKLILYTAEIHLRCPANNCYIGRGEGTQNDDWKVDGDRKLSGPWTGFTQLPILKSDSTSGISVVRGEKTENATSRPDHIRPQVWSKHVKDFSAKMENSIGQKKSRSSTSARRLRGIYIILLRNIWNARRKLDSQME